MAETTLVTLPNTLRQAGTHDFGPYNVPDGITGFGLLFPATDTLTGWSLDTWWSLDGGATWVYGGGCGRADAGVGEATQTGIKFRPAPPGTSRQFKARLTLTKSLRMPGVLTVTDTPRKQAIQTPEHHSVAWDNPGATPPYGVDYSVTTVSTPSFTVGTGNNRAAILGLWTAGAVTSVSGNVGGGGYPASVISGAVGPSTGGNYGQLWGVIGPPSGSQTATFAWTGAVTASISVVVATGVHQTTAFNNGAATTSAYGTTRALEVTSTSGDLTCTMIVSGNADETATSDQTDRIAGLGGMDTGPGTGTTTHTWTDSTQDLSVVGANFVQAGGEATPILKPTMQQIVPLLAQ